MIKRILSFTVTTITAMAVSHGYADTVELAKAGTLKDAVSTPGSVSSLAVSGPMNAADFDFINRTMPNLVTIDLKGATIEAYSGSPVLTGYTTSPANVLPAYGLHGMKLTSVDLPQSVNAIGEGALAGISATSLSLPHVTTVGDGAFAGSVKLASVTLSSDAITLGKLAFAGCTSLTSMSFNTDRLPDGAFKNCTSLSSVASMSRLEIIGAEVFMGCTSLATFPFDESLTEIGDGAFEGSGLKNVDMSGCTALNAVGAWSFAKCASLESVILPENVQKIGEGAFFDDSSLASIVLPSAITNIEDFVMTGTSALASSNVVPENTETIGRYAYKGMSKMEHIVLPAGLTYIGDNAMEGMEALREVDVKGLNQVPELGHDVWKDVNQPAVALLVSDSEMGHLYKNADQWKEFNIDIPSLAQDIVIGDADSMADVKVGFEGRVLVIVAHAGLKDAVVSDINGVLIHPSSLSAERASFDTSGMGADFYTVSVTTADGRKGQFKLLRK